MVKLEEVLGVGPTAAKKLRNVGVLNAEMLAGCEVDDLQWRTKLGEGTCSKIIDNARTLIPMYSFRDAMTVHAEHVVRERIPFGIELVDDGLLGGIEMGSVVEFYGPYRSGKTNLCHQLAVMIQKEHQGKVVWIDADGTFSPLILRMIASRMDFDPNDALKRTTVAQVASTSHFMSLMDALPEMVIDEGPIMVVIDSISAVLHYTYLGLDKMRVVKCELFESMKRLKQLTQIGKVAVVYTNRVFEDIQVYGGNPNAPQGGHILSHSSNYRFRCMRRRDSEISIKLIDHVSLPPNEWKVLIGWGGLYASTRERKDTEYRILQEIENEEGKATEVERASYVDV